MKTRIKVTALVSAISISCLLFITWMAWTPENRTVWSILFIWIIVMSTVTAYTFPNKFKDEK